MQISTYVIPRMRVISKCGWQRNCDVFQVSSTWQHVPCLLLLLWRQTKWSSYSLPL